MSPAATGGRSPGLGTLGPDGKWVARELHCSGTCLPLVNVTAAKPPSALLFGGHHRVSRSFPRSRGSRSKRVEGGLTLECGELSGLTIPLFFFPDEFK